MFTLSPTCSSNTGELFAIMAAVGIAADLGQKRSHDSDTPRRIIIFSDCAPSLNAIRRDHAIPRSVKKCANGGGLMVKLAEKSLEISRSGVQLELRWVPGHSGNQGNQRAHILARRAAKARYKKAPLAFVAVLRAGGTKMREVVMDSWEHQKKRELESHSNTP
ncbi:hypothetical protein BJX66DRAFT_87987 [Aspergillus keveii]|uniref:RNase H type-1 domain-containing protein n=1 Tax=Aspergillus keveii TaxID=714993 RepID=A0ABR4GF09_9EURO